MKNLLNPFLEETELEFYHTIYQFSKKKIFPTAAERDEKEEWGFAEWKELSKNGFAGLPIPEEFGGQGANCFFCSLATDAFSLGALDMGFGLSWAAHMIIGSLPIVLHGTTEQKEKYLPKLASGEWIAGLALTEPNAGSDAAGLSTFAKATNDGYVLNGSKIYITNGPVGNLFIVMARTGKRDSRSPMGISAFLVESTFAGFGVGKVLKKLGHHTSMTSELHFTDMFVPKENLLGPEGSGFLRIGKSTLEWERTVLVAGVLGAMQYSLEAGVVYAHERKQFGVSIDTFFAIENKLTKIYCYLLICRNVLYHVARSKDKGNSLALESSLLKILVTEMGEEVANEIVQIHGGYGFMKEYHVERFYRDAKLGTIGGGTSEVQRNIVSSAFTSIEQLESSFEITNLSSDDGEYAQILFELRKAISEIAKTIQENPKSQELNFQFADTITLYVALARTYHFFLETTNSFSSTQETDLEFSKTLLQYSFFHISNFFSKTLLALHRFSKQSSGTQTETESSTISSSSHFDFAKLMKNLESTKPKLHQENLIYKKLKARIVHER